MARLAGKRALVTGGSRGIGAAVVAAMVAEGAQVLACGRGVEPDDLPRGAAWITADVSRRDAVEAIIGRVQESLGGLDVLVNNAGIQVEKTVTESSDEDWDNVIGINARAPFMLCRGLIPVMAADGGGSIVNIGSISGHHADPSMALYNASKAFIHGLTRSIAVDHGAEGIRCNAICPGWIMTGMADAAFAMADDPKRAETDALARHAVGRFGEPDDIARAAVWLASDDAAFVTGQTITVDGGLVAASPVRPGLF
ncbi:MAG: SDR family NAD(P)-dependent oxidoreductase [Candidatus Puniceispirillales bacterium]